MPPKPSSPCTEEGKLATPQKHEQEHASPVPVNPEPIVIPPPELELTALCDGATADIIEVADAAATVAIVVAAIGAFVATMPAVVPVPFCAMAICLNISWVLLAVGLIEKTMPFPQ
jgi:hypothetical protein